MQVLSTLSWNFVVSRSLGLGLGDYYETVRCVCFVGCVCCVCCVCCVSEIIMKH